MNLASTGGEAASSIPWLANVGAIVNFLTLQIQRHMTAGTSKSKKGELSPCVKKMLSKYFDKNLLNSIRIHTDGLPTIVGLTEYLSGPKGAVTWGNHVYFDEGQYDPFTSVGIAAIGHEAEHVRQFARLGKAQFAAIYADSYKNNVALGMSFTDAYIHDVLEEGPNALEEKIWSDLQSKYGNRPCP